MAGLLVKEALYSALEQIRVAGEVTETPLNIILQTCGEITVPALAIIDSKGVRKIVAPNGKKLYQVVGSSDNVYTCFKDELYCNCPSFQNMIVMKRSHFICKHLLAVMVASALKSYEMIQKDSSFVNKLITMEIFDYSL